MAERQRRDESTSIGWERMRAIFGNAPPLRTIREARSSYERLERLRFPAPPALLRGWPRRLLAVAV